MKICQIICSRGTGGLERHFVDLSSKLAERHEVVAIAHPAFRDRLSSRVQLEQVDVSGWRHDPRMLAKVARVIRRHDPDIVHAQANKAAVLVGTIRSLIRARRVATIHNIKSTTRMFDSFHRVIAVSRESAAQLDRPDVSVIYNGVEAPRFVEEPSRGVLEKVVGRELQGPVVISVGRLVEAKGFDQLLRAWKAIDASLVIVGDGPERSRLEGMIREFRLDDRVVLAGFQTNVPTLMASADLMVIASRNEGFPYVLVEGLHSRQVIVSTRVAGSTDVLPEAFLVDCDSVEQLAKTVGMTLGDIESARRAYAAVWEMAARELTLARMSEKTEQVYSQIL